MHSAEMVEVRNRNGQAKQKPNIVKDYNKYMSGIDLADQMMSYYSSLRKTIRWYKKLALHVLTMALKNAHQLHQLETRMTMTFLNFREVIIRDLIGEANPAVHGQHVPVPQNGDFHYLIPHPGKGKMKNCVLCNKNKNVGGRHTTRYECPVCPSNWKTKAHPSLCVYPCFMDYHRQLGGHVVDDDLGDE